MDTEIIITSVQNGPDFEQSIQYDHRAREFLFQVLLPLLANFKTEAIDYCYQRDSTETDLAEIKTQSENELKAAFGSDTDVDVRLMSSYGARMHLKGPASDIDFGIVVKNLSRLKLNAYGTILNQIGYKFNTKINNYYSFQKKISGIEIEAKIRDSDSSAEYIELHNCLDNLPQLTQQLLTYAKSIVVPYNALYKKIKKIIHSAYFTEVLDVYDFIVWFIL